MVNGRADPIVSVAAIMIDGHAGLSAEVWQFILPYRFPGHMAVIRRYYEAMLWSDGASLQRNVIVTKE